MFAADFTDPENARTILMAAAGLVVLAVLLAAGTVWWWRTSKVEHPALAPLEVMSSRRWTHSGVHEQEARLELARPDGAEPVEHVERPRPTEPASPSGPVLFDQDVHDESGALVAPETAEGHDVEHELEHDADVEAEPEGAPAVGAPLDPLLAPRRPE